MTKTYILDTNIILHSAESIFKFDEHKVIVPSCVLEELDSKKTEQNELGRNARAFSRYVDELRAKGNLLNGVQLNDRGGTLSIGIFTENMIRYIPYQDPSKIDNQILAYCLSIPIAKVSDLVLVSNDVNMRIKADIFGVKAESYRNDRISKDDSYTGIAYFNVSQADIDLIYQQKYITPEQLQVNADDYFPNQCFIVRNEQNLKNTALVRYIRTKGIFKLLPSNMRTCDITPRNVEQTFLLDVLKDPEISLVSVNGKAGSGKTLMALTAAINAVCEVGSYKKILLLKPIVSMDNAHDIGFLPGSMEEKLAPWMASYFDNVDVIMTGYNSKDDEDKPTKKKKTSKKDDDIDFEKKFAKTNPMQELIQHGLLEVGSLQHVRGRSLPNLFIILDEAQNITKHAVKTIITRLGEGSKIIIMGDETQIDSPYLDSTSNALSIVAEVMKDQDIAAHITLKKSERSKLAEIASELL